MMIIITYETTHDFVKCKHNSVIGVVVKLSIPNSNMGKVSTF